MEMLSLSSAIQVQGKPPDLVMIRGQRAEQNPLSSGSSSGAIRRH